MKPHLLFAGTDFDFAADLPANHEDLVQDLELPTLLEAMARGDRFVLEASRRVLLASLDSPESIRYRQRVLEDCLAHPEVVRSMYGIVVDALEETRRIWSGYGGSFQNPSSNLSGAIGHLEAYVVRLRGLRGIADEHVASFSSEGMRALFSSLQLDLDDGYFAEINSHLKALRFRTGVVLSAELDWDNTGMNFVLRGSRAGAGWKERLGIGERSRYSFSVPPQDDAGHQVLGDLVGRGVNLVANAAAQSADHIKSYFAMLRFELAFYVGCINLRERVGEDVLTCWPEPAPMGSTAFSCSDLRDPCLALRSSEPVVGNDVEGDGRPLVIVTGANSGGKSTFLRSVGVAQLMMGCGMYVAARSYRAEVASGVFTHFIREEDPTMTSGRLDEELARMSRIADELRPHCLVLFNESFAGTNEHEGSEIARQVVLALLEAETRVFFVTHRFAFAESFVSDSSLPTLFLRAERRADGRRDYKLVEKEPLPTSFGKDLYYELGAWLTEDRDEQA